ncbi:MAG: DUF1638 domain-containing protein [Clostridiales Family XIII bacterium]|jgi:hypothetical protein|nr:DUF1638 domain-containing protein [Clostridiales Family XIII bacterium]
MKINHSNAAIISCEIFRDDFEYLLGSKLSGYTVRWIDKGLHDHPDKLRAKVQAAIDEIDAYGDVSYILLGYCLCGKSVVGLKSQNCTMIMPKTDDCVRMYQLMEKNVKPDVCAAAYYLTPRWMDPELSSVMGADKWINKYGKERAKMLIKAMFGNYTDIILLHLESFDPAAYRDEARAAAERINLKFTEKDGTLRILKKMLAADIDDEFVIIEPNQEIDFDMFDGRI